MRTISGSFRPKNALRRRTDAACIFVQTRFGQPRPIAIVRLLRSKTKLHTTTYHFQCEPIENHFSRGFGLAECFFVCIWRKEVKMEWFSESAHYSTSNSEYDGARSAFEKLRIRLRAIKLRPKSVTQKTNKWPGCSGGGGWAADDWRRNLIAFDRWLCRCFDWFKSSNQIEIRSDSDGREDGMRAREEKTHQTRSENGADCRLGPRT